MPTFIRRCAAIGLVVLLPACGGIATPGTPPNEFSSGNFSVTIVASASCSMLIDAAQTRSWKLGLVKTGTSVAASMQGWSNATVVSQTNLQGTASGSSLKLTGYIYDTVDGCSNPLCYRAEGTIAATQSGNVLNGTLNGTIGYDEATCTATDHQITLNRT